MKRTFTIISLALLFTCCARADYLKAQRRASIKQAPQSGAASIVMVNEGAVLILLNDAQTDGYYSVRVPDGRSGWIYRTLVRRFPGAAPSEPAPQTQPTNGEGGTGVLPTYSAAELGYAAHHLSLGKPNAMYERFREGYTVGYDARLKIPAWVQYVLSSGELDGSASRDGRDFVEDTTIPAIARSDNSDYDEPVYDQGHMAPANDMERSEKVMEECFLYSNCAPQIGVGFNRQIWMRLEVAVHGWARQRGQLTVITGPVFAAANNKIEYPVIGRNQVAVPSHFYKIVVDAGATGGPEVLAFLMPNQNLSGHQYSEYLCSVREIEKATGLDFLSALPRDVQERIETVKAAAVW